MADRNLVIKHRGGIYSTGEGMVLTIPPSGFDWRAVVGGSPGVVDPFAFTLAQEFPLGTKLEYGLRKFRYAQNGGTLGEIGALEQAVVPLAGHINEVVGTHAVGDVAITFTPNTCCTDDLTANELQDGFLYIYDAGGEGGYYQVLSHPAITGGASGVITLADPIRVAVAAAATATVLHNPYRQHIIHPSPPTAQPLGWNTGPVTASYYHWLQTGGPCAAQIDGTVIMGEMVRPSEDDDGAVALLDYDEAADADHGPVGRVLEIGADGAGAQATFGSIWAMLDN
jgi:hypothetical protein